MHPSNIHDNAYAFGTVDFTGDMPVILGPDGPSLGGFVCPATVIDADLWKLGQLKAGDRLRFVPIALADADRLAQAQRHEIAHLQPEAVCVAPALPRSIRSCTSMQQPPGGLHCACAPRVTVFCWWSMAR